MCGLQTDLLYVEIYHEPEGWGWGAARTPSAAGCLSVGTLQAVVKSSEHTGPGIATLGLRPYDTPPTGPGDKLLFCQEAERRESSVRPAFDCPAAAAEGVPSAETLRPVCSLSLQAAGSTEPPLVKLGLAYRSGDMLDTVEDLASLDSGALPHPHTHTHTHAHASAWLSNSWLCWPWRFAAERGDPRADADGETDLAAATAWLAEGDSADARAHARQVSTTTHPAQLLLWHPPGPAHASASSPSSLLLCDCSERNQAN